jgi:hypothetical protein
MLVADLKNHLQQLGQERSLTTTLGEMAVDEEARFIQMADGETFQLDEQAERSLAQYLGISKAYLAKCPADLKSMNLNYWLQRRGNAAAVIEATDENWVTIHKPGLLILPLARVAEVVTETMDPDYEIVSLIRNDTKFHIDIITPHSVTVEPDERIEDRQQGTRSVGDITHGGVRIISNPTAVEAPQVLTYLHRLWCTNGSTSPEAEGTIRLKGNTIDDIFVELEGACRRVMGDLDSKLADYAALARTFPPGSPVRFAYQLGREYGLPQRLMDRIMERVNVLPEDATLYDIQQVFTELANGAVNYRTMVKLQHISGDLAFNTDHVTHRCGTCERLLPEA